MSELGDLLELLHRAHRSFGTVRYEAREWRHTRRTHTLPSGTCPTSGTFRSGGGSRRQAASAKSAAEGGRLTIDVSDGSRWWQALPECTTTSDEGDGRGTGRVGVCVRQLVDPSPLATGLDLEPGARSQRAGREAIVVAATPRPGPFGFQHDVLLTGADRHELAVDAERGVLLAATSFLDDGVFRHVPAAAEQVALPGEVRSGDVVTVSVYRDDGTHSVTLRQSARPWESWQTNRTQESERDGRPLRTSVGPWHRVLVEQEGTHVEVDSGMVETDALVALALTLVPAPSEPPPLVA